MPHHPLPHHQKKKKITPPVCFVRKLRFLVGKEIEERPGAWVFLVIWDGGGGGITFITFFFL